MPKSKPERFVKYYRDGSIWARGWVLDDKPVGFWAFYRIDGTKLRTGYFREGVEAGKWTHYDHGGNVQRVEEL